MYAVNKSDNSIQYNITFSLIHIPIHISPHLHINQVVLHKWQWPNGHCLPTELDELHGIVHHSK